LLGEAVHFQQNSELAAIGQDGRVQLMAFDDFLTAAQVPVFWGSNFAVVRRDIFANSGGFREELRVFEDQDLGLRLGTVHGFVKIVAPATVAYRETPGLTGDLDKTFAGILFILQQETAGRYPGENSRRWERRRYIAYSARSVSFDLLHNLRTRDALNLYWRTLAWHICLRRFRFAFGFPVICAFRSLTRVRSREPALVESNAAEQGRVKCKDVS
jgi:hypothetical protein